MSIAKVSVTNVVVHPLVLLSVIDHYKRMSLAETQKRAVGVLLGCFRSKGVLDISNSFALPFEEDSKDESVWYVDHDYMETMFDMYRKVSAKERIIGWYHTGPKMRRNDIIINELFRRYCPYAVMLIIDPEPKSMDQPTKAYFAKEEVHDDGTPTVKTFDHVSAMVGAEEAEEVGVEHLMRDYKDITATSLAQTVTARMIGIKGLKEEISIIRNYCARVGEGNLPVNHQISYLIQEVMNLMPDVTSEDFKEVMFSNVNDQMLVVYVGSMVRAITGLHDVIINKKNLAAKKAEETEKDDAEAAADKEDKSSVKKSDEKKN